jgi:hypothetical protein
MFLTLCCASVAGFTACKKEAAHKTTCTSTVHAYTAPVSLIYGASGSLYACNHGIVNTSTAGIATTGSFTNSVMLNNKATYSVADNSYYCFSSSYISGVTSTTLHRIDASGIETTYASADTFNYSMLVYNPFNSKLYCFNNYGKIVSLTLGTTTFSATVCATPLHSISQFNYGDFTVDHATGAMYYVSGNTPYYIEKFQPGSSSTTVVASGAGALSVLGLAFNKNNNKLYAMKMDTDYSTFEFITVDPSAGTITSAPGFGLRPNVDLYSATIDPCSNRYLLSTTDTAASISVFKLYQVDMTGALVQQNTIPTPYQGLDVVY